MPQGVRLAAPPRSLGDLVGVDDGWVKKVLDLLGPKDDLGVTPAAIVDPASQGVKLLAGGLKGPLKPGGLKANFDDLINKMRTLLPKEVSEPLREWTNAASRPGRTEAINQVKANPDLLSRIQGLVGQKLGPEFPVYRGTNSYTEGAQALKPANIVDPRGYSLSPSQGVMFASGGPAQNAQLVKGIGTPESTLLPGARVEHELIMDPTKFKGTPQITRNPNNGQIPPSSAYIKNGVGQLPMNKGQSSKAGEHWFGEGYTPSPNIDPPMESYAESLTPSGISGPSDLSQLIAKTKTFADGVHFNGDKNPESLHFEGYHPGNLYQAFKSGYIGTEQLLFYAKQFGIVK